MTDIFWVPGPWPGKLAIVARPRGGDWLLDETTSWRRAGLDMIVSLLEDEEARQLELVQEAHAVYATGARYVSFPIPDRGVPASSPRALALFRDLAKTLEEGKNVGVHCRQSIGRAGLIATGVLMTAGLSTDDALKLVSRARGQIVPETHPQLRWLQNLPVETAQSVTPCGSPQADTIPPASETPRSFDSSR